MEKRKKIDKGTNSYLHDTSQKTKDRVTRTPLKTESLIYQKKKKKKMYTCTCICQLHLYRVYFISIFGQDIVFMFLMGEIFIFQVCVCV